MKTTGEGRGEDRSCGVGAGGRGKTALMGSGKKKPCGDLQAGRVGPLAPVRDHQSSTGAAGRRQVKKKKRGAVVVGEHKGIRRVPPTEPHREKKPVQNSNKKGEI